MGFSGSPHGVRTVYTLMLTGVVLVYGVDLFPPPQQWVPPNCILEVDDILKPWAWQHKWDLIHMRQFPHALNLYLLAMLTIFRTRSWLLQSSGVEGPLSPSL